MTIYTDSPVLARRQGERHIVIRSHVMTAEYGFMEEEVAKLFFSNFLEERVKDYAIKRLTPISYLQSWDISHDWTWPSIFSQTFHRMSFVMTAHIALSGHLDVWPHPREQRATLALPGLIVSHGCTVTVSHTRVIDYLDVSTFLGEHWHEMPPRTYSRVLQSLSSVKE